MGHQRESPLNELSIREAARTSEAAIAQIDSSAANKNSITLRLLSKSLGGPFSSGPSRPRRLPFSIFFFFYLFVDAHWKKCSTMLSRHRELAADVGYPISLSFPPPLLSLSLSPFGQPVYQYLSAPRPAFAVEHRVLHIYIPACPFTQLCFCVQINLRRVKNGKRQSFGVDSDCFIVFRVNTSSSFDKRSNWALDPFLQRLNWRTNKRR